MVKSRESFSGLRGVSTLLNILLGSDTILGDAINLQRCRNYVSHVLAARGFLDVAPNRTADLTWQIHLLKSMYGAWLVD
ncbi:hypothetical protein EV426DRAFT_604564 [Tirmania nivea]|nr:hypothetical protein EV426DRAFT_604564 [Tirmania nivea]